MKLHRTFTAWTTVFVLYGGMIGCTLGSGDRRHSDGLPDEIGSNGDSDAGEGGGCIVVDAGTVVFSELMVNPDSAAGLAGQFIELYNTSDRALLMEGWVLLDGLEGAASLTLPVGKEFPPYSYLLLAFEADPNFNGQLQPALIVESIDLASQKLIVVSGGIVIDELDFSGSGWPSVRGASFNLATSRLDATLNDDPSNWCASFETYGAGDFGTPGQPNVECLGAPVCGDQSVEAPEQCDDGQNTDEHDGCKYNCRFSCAEPNADCTDEVGDCQRPVCVGSVHGQICGTAADNADLPNDENPCTQDLCVEGVPSNNDHDDGMPCDNSAGAVGDYCLQGDCIDAVCGDWIRGPLEECDDGGQVDGDGCSAECLWEACGNSRVDYAEDCDDGKDGDDLDGCKDDCHFTCSNAQVDCIDIAGDCHTSVCVANDVGQVCSAQVHTSDVPIDDNSCTEDVCDTDGNASNPLAEDGTACDNASGLVGDYCDARLCIDPVCNDGIKGPLEACDDGNDNPCDGCLPSCITHSNYCSDTYACPPEQCDDGNSADGDGCSFDCQLEPNVCPDDMVAVPAGPELGVYRAFCMDRYEASRTDATIDSQGTESTTALSQPDVIPWHTDYYLGESMSTAVFAQYQSACQNAGKRLCTEEEWYLGCTGPDRNTYVFGNGFDREICNCVDTFCDDYCALHPEITNCDVGYNCGYTYDSFRVVPTGQFSACENHVGAYDVCGNVWEVVPSTDHEYGRSFEIRGGAFNCAYPDIRLQCTYNANWTSLFAGFRCCKDLD